MTSPNNATDFLHDLRQRNEATDGIFWIDDNILAIFEPDAARRVTGRNWHRFALVDKPMDMLLRRRSPEVLWSQVRGHWMTQLHQLTAGQHNTAMIVRMRQVIDARVDGTTDLVRLAQDVATEAILPVALSGLTPTEARHVRQDLDQKLARLLASPTVRGLWRQLQFLAAQIRAGLVVRRVMRDRASGRRPRELDLADPFVEMLPRLGMARAVDVVSTVLTAIGGPPGSAAASTLYELARHPEWMQRLVDELRELGLAEFAAAPTKVAPVTHRFVKEVLRLWSPPLLLVRHAQVAMDLGVAQLEPGVRYIVSPHMVHRSDRYWPDADTFDPDRFLPGAPNGTDQRGHYVPFGWAPKKCPGADLATIHLMAWCYLLCTQYRLNVPDIDNIAIAFRFAPVPQQFHGVISIR